MKDFKKPEASIQFKAGVCFERGGDGIQEEMLLYEETRHCRWKTLHHPQIKIVCLMPPCLRKRWFFFFKLRFHFISSNNGHIFLDAKLLLPDLGVRETFKALNVAPC